ncbi:MAG TPA: hypothetical protein H9955_07930 [Candidatus Mediterraneibacter cottocaccae]|nr:hypothetical protein [Candidatus Mediterraneibacter cottocaccae]
MHGILHPAKLQNFDTWQRDRFADYGGSDRKDGLIAPDGALYLIKYAENHTRKNELDTSYVNNALSEYLSSHILGIIGYDVHETLLGTRNNEIIVACKNFVPENQKLIEFGRYLRKHYDSGELGRVPEIGQIKDTLREDEDLSPVSEQLWESYCCRFVGDAFVGNFDRHMGNWGYLVSRTDPVRPSPIYDNGSTLFPALSEHAMKTDILPNEKEILKRTLLFPKAALIVHGQKVSYYDMLCSDFEPQITKAVLDIVPVIKDRFPEINRFIDEQEFLSDVRKTFYKTMLAARYYFLLEPAWEICAEQKFSRSAGERLEKGIPYTEEMFERDYQKMMADEGWKIRDRKYQKAVI